MQAKPIPGFEERYAISRDGTVRSIGGWSAGRTRKPVLNRVTGYYQVNLWNGQKYVLKALHRLVAEAFVPRVPGKEYINHIDGNKLNNAPKNLEWVTTKENNHHYIASVIIPDRIVLEKVRGRPWKGQPGYNYRCQCPQCDKRFWVKGCYVNDGKYLFCSRPCTKQWKLTHRVFVIN